MKKFIVAGLIISLQAGASAQQPGASGLAALANARPGEVLNLPGFFAGKIPEMAYRKAVLPGPQFIISDDPEYIREAESIALQEKVSPGAVRLYVYNVNGVTEPSKMARKITTLIKNTGWKVMHLHFEKFSSQLPSTNYYQIGKQGLADYFTSKVTDSGFSIPPGEAVPIDPARERQVVQYDELVHGIYEFTIDQPAEVTVLQTSPGTPGPVALKRIHSVVPPSHSNAGRGLFSICNYGISTEKSIDTRDGPVTLTIADGKKDPWITGREGSTGQTTTLSGNYGVIYHIEMKWKSTDGKGLALVTWNPWNGNNQWCGGMANTVVVSDGKYKGGVIQLPADRLITNGAPEAILIQVFQPSRNGEEQVIKLIYSPPGASCIPTPLVFIPVELSK